MAVQMADLTAVLMAALKVARKVARKAVNLAGSLELQTAVLSAGLMDVRRADQKELQMAER